VFVKKLPLDLIYPTLSQAIKHVITKKEKREQTARFF